MGLEQVGIELVATGANNFASAVGKAVSSLNVFERAGKLAAASLKALDQVITGALRRIGELFVDGLIRAGRELFRFGQRVVEAAAEGTALDKSLDAMGQRLLGITKFNLDPLFTQLDGLLTRAAPAVEGFVNFFTSSLSGIAQDALTYGENISISLANGLWAGANAILDALIDIANMITYWLSPGSPPRLLPDLDTWGTEAANVYLAGWGNADFDVFNTISGTIEALLRSAAPRGDTNLIPTILGTREAIAQAIDQARELGTVTQASLDAIFQAAGATTPAMREYLESTFRLELANDNLSLAQLELNRVTKQYQDLLAPLDAEINAISEAQQQLTEDGRISQLELVANDPNATLAEKQMARLEIERMLAERNRRALLGEAEIAKDAAQEKVDAAQASVDQAQAEYDAKLALIELQTEQNRLIQEQLALLERLAAMTDPAGGRGTAGPGRTPAGGAGRAGGGIGAIKPEFDLTDFIPQELLDKLAELKAAFEATWQRILEVLQPAIDIWNNEVVPAWDRLVKAFTDSLPVLEREISKFVAFVFSQLGQQLPTIFKNVASSLNTLSEIWEENHVLILGATGAAFSAIFAIILSTMTIISGVIAAVLNAIEFLWSAALKALRGDWRGAWEEIKNGVIENTEIMRATIKTALDGYLSMFGTTVDDIQKRWADGWTGYITKVREAVQDIKNAFNSVDWASVGQSIINGIIAGIAGAIGGLVAAAAGAATAALGAARDALLPGSPSRLAAQEVGVPFAEGIAKGITDSVAMLRQAAMGAVGQMVSVPASQAQVYGNSYANSLTNVYNLSVNSTQRSQGVIGDFSILAAMS